MSDIKELLTVTIVEAVWLELTVTMPWLKLPIFKQIGQLIVARAIAKAIENHADVPWKPPAEAKDMTNP